MENGGGITLLQTRGNNNTMSRCGGGYIFVVPGYTTIKFKRWGVMWQEIFYALAITFKEIYIIRRGMRCNTTIKIFCFRCNAGHAINFSEVYNN